MAAKMVHCFAQQPHLREHEVFHCRICVGLRHAMRISIFVAFGLFLYWFWGHAS